MLNKCITLLRLLMRLLFYSQANNDIRTAMQGMTMKSIKHHVALQPLFVIMGAGIAFVCLYVGR